MNEDGDNNKTTTNNSNISNATKHASHFSYFVLHQTNNALEFSERLIFSKRLLLLNK